MTEESSTYRIDVSVLSEYLPLESDSATARFVFSYTVTLRNLGTVTARLLSRHWVITDGEGHVQEVRGEGVVGEQPTLEPGATYTYSSGAMLETPVGSMRGSYQMVAEDGTHFEAEIPVFTLAVPSQLH
ncbi:Co2+/Mg2+ efflux protein ApaG [Candidatus Macondimonas diazotrophica]|uniref:Protein ApaG n=1 Tax=Candidatus Macondimonas diazotrophica TaxID=2305248 RepID=A0A4Z0F9B7_9GAMM|nr:Co2+/Mg2+ efflux protein ApaG [Candidatus Macondimonas diazotrophica]MDY6955495.1 Co2+/Mg2+ efflux protein ApaG [Pseudomonadota bacterium]NCU01605.1 Co2+/Mg2+ efflux protein ApaG [Candidatus Macondimonas diazotrophica]TFZ82401.1 Co2+/Mg2+ efflux protein ApaG [Candidatus Macondimonas diazotrophica]HBG30782.1 Co2+/Mg2+ efflux protein ApaG [Gammaproteobacteria bacterium]